MDFKRFDNSIGKRLKFEVPVLLPNGEEFNDEFYGILREIGDDFIIVEHYYLKSDKDFNQGLTSQKRKLVKNEFKLFKNPPLGH